MGIEREHHGRPARTPRLGRQALHDPRVPQVDAVEIADRHRAAAKCIRQIVQAAENSHGVGSGQSIEG